MSSTLIGGLGFVTLGDRLTGRMADSDSVDRGSNPRLPVNGSSWSVAQRQQRRSYKAKVVGSIPTAPIFFIWSFERLGS